ncbi:hypothetical protein GALL_492380 [mine drainage metagenome]|uniref:Uncharacterized protein n=1 Tax=mine drainage metagenome TaxID=410659 RepID=A0A1J5PNK6_9ZZZZ
MCSCLSWTNCFPIINGASDAQRFRSRCDLANPQAGDSHHAIVAADRYAHRLVAGTYPLVGERGCRCAGGAAHRAAAIGDRFLSVAGDGAEWTDWPFHPGAGAGHAAVHVLGAGSGVGFLFDAVRCTADTECVRSHRRAPAGSGGNLARLALRYLPQRSAAIGQTRIPDRDRTRIRPYRR